MLFFDLRSLVIRALGCRMPQRLGCFVPALGAQIARLWNIVAAHAAVAGGASTLDGQKGAADRGSQRGDTDADPQGREPRRPLTRRYGQPDGLSVLRGQRKRRRFRRPWTWIPTISYGDELNGEAFEIGFASLGRARGVAGRVECLPVRS